MKLPGQEFFRQQGRYAAHSDPANAALNTIALVIAWNGPFYPAYVIGLIGRPGLASLLTMIGSPFFYAVPWLGRQNSRIGRIALPVIGLVNTLCCVKLFGPDAGVTLFFIPCILLAALLFRADEVRTKWLLISLGVVAFWLPAWLYGAPLLSFSAPALARLRSLNLLSVASLSGFIALRFAGVFATLAAAARPDRL